MALHIVGPGFSTLVRSVRLYCLEKGLHPTYGMTLDGAPVALRSEAHYALHPFAKVPVLVHDGRPVFESVAICRYLDRVFPTPSAEPADLAEATLIDQWASALATTADSCVVRRYLLTVAGPRPDKSLTGEALAQIEADVRWTLEIVQAQLAVQPYLCGARFSLPDALLAPMLDYLDRVPGRHWLDAFAPLADYLHRLRSRPSGQAVLIAADFAQR